MFCIQFCLLPWLPNLIRLYDFIAMETPIVLNNLPKTNISVTTFLISVKIDFYTVLPVAMVTQFNNISWFYDLLS